MTDIKQLAKNLLGSQGVALCRQRFKRARCAINPLPKVFHIGHLEA